MITVSLRISPRNTLFSVHCHALKTSESNTLGPIYGISTTGLGTRTLRQRLDKISVTDADIALERKFVVNGTLLIIIPAPWTEYRFDGPELWTGPWFVAANYGTPVAAIDMSN